MAKGFSVFVEIGGKIGPSFTGAIKTAEDKLAGLSRRMKAQAVAQRAAIKEIGSSLKGVAGLAAAGGLTFGLKGAFGKGADLAHEIQGMRNAGRSAHEVAEGIEAATAAIAKLPTASLVTGIKLLNETTGAFGDYHHAVENLEFNSKLADVLKNTVHVEDPAHAIGSLIKALEIRGSAVDPAKYRRESEMLTQAMTFFGGRLKPEDIYTFASNAQVGIRQLNERFLTRIAPSLIQELGGDKTGTGLTAFRTIIGGRKLSDNAQAAEWVKLGLVDRKMLIKNKMGDTKGWKDGAVIKTREAYQDPLQWMEDEVLPRLKNNGVDIADPIKLGQALNTLFKNTKANGFVTAISGLVDRTRLKKDEALINKVLSVDDNYDSSLLNDPRLAQFAAKSALGNMGSALTLPLMKPLAQGLIAIARALNQVSAALMRSPGAAKALAGLIGAFTALAALRLAGLVLGITGIARALALLLFSVPLGAAARLLGLARAIMLLTAAASLGAVARLRTLATALALLAVPGGARLALAALGGSLLAFGRALLMFPLVALRAIPAALMLLVSNPIGIAVAAIVTALAALGLWISNNSSGIVTFFTSFYESFMKALGPGAASAVTSIVSALQSVWQWVNKILGPVDETGAKWKSWGEAAGQGAAGVVNALSGLPAQISALGAQLAEAGRTAMTSLWEGMKAVAESIIGWASGIAGRIAAPFVSIGSRIRGALGGAAPAQSSPAPVVDGARALGGPVRAGGTYLVGERGPEIFRPTGSGRIETNRTYNRLASFGSASGGSRGPTAAQMAAAGALGGGASGAKHVTRGNLSVSMTIQAGGGDAEAIGDAAERAVRRVLAQYESQQRGMLSD